jgi:hypothetical protein
MYATLLGEYSAQGEAATPVKDAAVLAIRLVF